MKETAKIGIVIFSLVAISTLVRFPLITVASIIILIILLLIFRKKYRLNHKRENLIGDGKCLDVSLSKVCESKLEYKWEFEAAKVPSASIIPINHSKIESEIERIDSMMDDRREYVSYIEDLLSKEDIVNSNFDKQINLVEDKQIAHKIAQPYIKSFEQVDQDIYHTRFCLLIYILDGIRPQFTQLSQVDVSPLISNIENQDSSNLTINHTRKLSLLVAKCIVTIKKYPEFEDKKFFQLINDALQNKKEIDEVDEYISSTYYTLLYMEKIDDLLHEIELSHTDVDPEVYQEKVDEAIMSRDHEQLEILHGRLQRLSEKSWKYDDLYKYDWDSFEVLISQLWQEKNYNTEKTPGSGDRGVDVRAINKANNADHVLIQVKQYKPDNKVGRPVIQKILGTLSADTATRAAVVTSSSFTQPAISEANKVNPKVELINGRELLDQLSNTSIAPPTVEQTHESEGNKIDHSPEEIVYELLD